MIRYVAPVVVLTLVYTLALASFHLWDLLIGAVLSATLLFAFGRFVFGASARGVGQGLSPLGRIVAFVPFAAAVARETLAGAWRVFLVTLHLREPANPGIVTVPLEERTPTGVAVSAFLAGFSPGTLLVKVDEEERVMLIHAIDAADPDAVREARQEFYRRYQKKVFP